MPKYDYSEDTKRTLTNINNSNDMILKSIVSAFTTDNKNIDELFRLCENLQRETGIIKKILSHIVSEKPLEELQKDQNVKEFLKLD